MFSNNLLINSIETEKEKHFNRKCKNLLNYYSKDSIIEMCHNLSSIENILVSNVISFDDICHILIKKYYISDHKPNNYTAEFNMYIEQLNFENAHQLLIASQMIKEELFNVYFNYLDIKNNSLVIEKACAKGYDNVNTTLVALNNFYLTKRVKNNIEQHKVLKKSYNK